MLHFRKTLLITVLVIGAMVAGGYWAARIYLPVMLAEWVEAPAFNRMLSSAVSHALKVDGSFGHLHLGPDLSVTTQGFRSTGWPGQTIGGLDAGKATGWFNPWGILRGRWQVDLISISHADFRLVPPNNALKKEDPTAPPKPWYAFLMPSQFFCRWIECPDMTIELPVGETTARGTNLSVGAMMIGKNFKYFGRDGVLHYPGYDTLAVDAMEVYVTREMIDIGYLYLRQPDAARSSLLLKARLGQHQDKSIDASATIDSLNIAPFLPPDVAEILQGELNGNLTYKTDTSGKNASGGGTLSLANAKLHDWDYLERLAERSGNQHFATFLAEEVALVYELNDGTFKVTNLVIKGKEMVDLRGEGTWDIDTSTASLNVQASRIPLGAYLPPTIAGSLRGDLAGEVRWSWSGTDLSAGHGGGRIAISGCELDGFKFQQFLDRFLKSNAYANINIKEATAQWHQNTTGLHLEKVQILAPGQAGLRGNVHVSPDGKLSGNLLAGLPASSLTWLPEATSTVFPRQEDGLHWATIRISGTVEKPEMDFTRQVVRQLEKHPIALAELALKGLSWWIGDALGTDKNM